jgi:hypothetical protein
VSVKMGNADSEDAEGDESFMRRYVIPEEDRRRSTTAPYSGGYRWFRSPNIICLERYRRDQRRGACSGSHGGN